MKVQRNAPNLTQERLRELLDYNPETGELTWLVRRPRAKIGALAGASNTDGYVCIKLDGTAYRAHRLAWLYVHRRWPVAQLDHINGRRDDNRISNLRECSSAENQQNLVSPSTKKSGLPLGVSPVGKKYQAQIRHAGKQKHLGLFPTPEEAHAAYLAAKAVHHPFQPVPRVQEAA